MIYEDVPKKLHDFTADSFTEYLGLWGLLPALLLRGYDFGKSFIPFYKNGIENAESFELCMIAIKYEKDASLSFVDAINNKRDDETCRLLAYNMLKSFEVARESGIASIGEKEFEKYPNTKNNLELRKSMVSEKMRLLEDNYQGSTQTSFLHFDKGATNKKLANISVMVVPISSEDSHSSEIEINEIKYSDDVFYSYWNNYLIPKYGLEHIPKLAKVWYNHKKAKRMIDSG